MSYRPLLRQNRFWRIVWPAALLLAALLALARPLAAQNSPVLVAEVEGPVTPAMASYFERLVAAAEEQQAAAVIVLNTPGGGLEPTLAIVQSFRNATAPIIVFIAPAGAQAASAGSIIVAAAHAAGMAPETVVGAASPVGSGGEDIGETLQRKVSEDLKATMRNLTARRGEAAVALAEAMIDEARAVTADEALEVGFIDAVAPDLNDLLRQLDGRTVIVAGREVALQTAGAPQERFPMTAVERVLHALSNPTLLSLLLVVGVQALLIEIGSPGGWVAGFIGVLCLGLALYGLGTITANWLGLGLIAVAFVLLLLEVKAATHGALATAGIATLLAGLLVLFNSPGTPEFARLSLPTAVAISLVTAAFFLFILTKAVQSRSRPVLTGEEGLVGRTGQVRRPFEAEGEGVFAGTVLVYGELWRATAGVALAKGEAVVVESKDGLTLRVGRRADDG